MQGILGMLSAIKGQQFFLECYNPLGEMMDMMALINSAANFFLYFIMSSEFKKTLRTVFGIRNSRMKRNITFSTRLDVSNVIYVIILVTSISA